MGVVSFLMLNTRKRLGDIFESFEIFISAQRNERAKDETPPEGRAAITGNIFSAFVALKVKLREEKEQTASCFPDNSRAM